MKVTLHLNDIHQLFVAPEFDPFEPDAVAQSGMDQLVDALKPSGLRDRLEAVVILPAEEVTADVAERIHSAVTRYCRFQIDENRRELASLRWQGVKSLQTGVIFLALCLLLSASIDGAEALPGTLRRLGSEGFLIAGWVSMWHPAELLLYAWWPYWRQMRVYEHIMGMDISVQPKTVEKAAYAR